MAGATVVACASGAGDASSLLRASAVADDAGEDAPVFLEPPASMLAPLEPNRGATAAGAAFGRLSALAVPGVTGVLVVLGVTGALGALGSGPSDCNGAGAAAGASLVALLVATSRARS